ncbi:serine/threonine protein kinase [Proteus mirabilis]|nr:serine/threonine protein kinase [Proteus mirabilis]HEK1816944.1 serine/threonine protein kinase [Proteus mirabilis]HEK2144666.1 serine/threonine protein kinase [Proteus mirabilis]HEK2857206.1 serine/threonine protein kinase [Proteus mirabilis]
MAISASFNFQGLFPDSIWDALINIGFYPDSGLTELNSYENRVFQFMDEHKQRYVVKFYRPQRWSYSQIKEEHEFVLALKEAQVSVAAPIEVKGETVHLSNEGFYFALFPSIGGRAYETDNLFQLEEVGRTLGRIHQIGRKKSYQYRPTLSVADYLVAPKLEFEQSDLVPTQLKSQFIDAIDKIIHEVSPKLSDSTWKKLRLHGDCHPGNILWRDEVVMVDFDDSRMGSAIQDFWMLLSGSKQDQLIQLDTLLESYNEYQDFDVRELSLIEPLRAMRMVHYIAWVLKRWKDPAFPRTFVWFQEQDFWFKQLALFKGQVEQLNEPPLQLSPMY